MWSSDSTPSRISAIINIAAGRNQLPLIVRAKQLGFQVIAVDRSPQAPGFALADAGVVHSAFGTAGRTGKAIDHPRSAENSPGADRGR